MVEATGCWKYMLPLLAPEHPALGYATAEGCRGIAGDIVSRKNRCCLLCWRRWQRHG